MGKKRGKYIKQAPTKKAKYKLRTGVIAAVILLIVVTVILWVWPNESEVVPNGPEDSQVQTESHACETAESNQNNTQSSQGETSGVDETSGVGETGPQYEPSDSNAPSDSGDFSEPNESSATVVDAYLKEINGELHLIKVLSDGTEIDAGPVENTKEDEPTVTYCVTFMNYDGTILKTETVKCGGSATPPAAPTREGYTFIGWSGSYSNVNADVTVVAQYQMNAPEVVQYTVRFIDYDGTVLKTQSVEKGQAATAPADPIREGYKFTGWDKAFTNVDSDLTITAQYEELPSTDLTITVGNQTAAPGETVKVAISLKNNPGVVGITLKLTYDESAVTLTAVEKGSALGEMTFTKPGKLNSGCNLLWDAEFVTPEEASNGEILILTFRISDTAAAGNYSVSLSAVGEIIDNDLMPVTVVLQNGIITIQ